MVMRSVNSIIHTELTFAAKIDTTEKVDNPIQSTIYNTIENTVQKCYLDVPTNPS